MALVLPGGGARAAYQVGFLHELVRRVPDVRFDVLHGISAGAVNATFLANHEGSLADAVSDLREFWLGLRSEDVFRTDPAALAKSVIAWAARLFSGGAVRHRAPRGLVDTRPLRRLLRRVLGADSRGRLPGIEANLEAGRLRALAVTASSYAGDGSVTFVEGDRIATWARRGRRAVRARITVDHVMASAALPLVFPPVRVGGHWYGDGGVRLSAPLSPAVHLGADRILAITTNDASPPRHAASSRPPSPASVAGQTLDAVFLDLLEQDARRIEVVNRLLAAAPREASGGLRPVELVVARPRSDLAAAAREHERSSPEPFRFLSRGWGTGEGKSGDVLSLLLFERDYIEQLLEAGARDAAARTDEMALLFRGAEPETGRGAGAAA